ncbi:MAG: nucleotidyltransferase [Erysipelotrichaceae bacterium]|nr:nucleotidyltransferase [Erysipelotrichaceae bacterium]
MTLKELRKEKELSQLEASKIANVSLRTYIYYEKDVNKVNTNTYKFIFDSLDKYNQIDEDHGIIPFNKIVEKLMPILTKHNINLCYIFGSYAKGTATESSDIDILIDTDIIGLEFFNLIEELRLTLKKKIDLLRLKDITPDNPISLNILKYGKRII